jgi:hypothetical protein
MTKQIKVLLDGIPVNSGRNGCDVCGEHHHGYAIFAILPDDVWVCEMCIAYPEVVEHADPIDEQLEAMAASLERQAAKTRALIGELKLPSRAEFDAAVDAARAGEREADEWADAHLDEALA